VYETFGTRGQVKINATFDGESYRGSLAPMGGAQHFLGVLKQIREKIGKNIGDSVHVTIVKDEEERVVEIPIELQQIFDANTSLKAVYDKLSYTARKEMCRDISEAKKPETKLKKIDKAVQTLMK